MAAECPKNPWILTGAVFMSHFFTCGVSFSIGVYYVTFLETFGLSNGATAWIGSLNLGTLCGTGPLASYMIDKLGMSHTVMIGGLTSSLGILIGSFSPNISVLFVSLGFVTGVGYGMVFTTGVVVIGVTLTKYRTLAMGISISGIGVGNFAYPFLANHLMAVYGWRGALLITSAITLNVCVFGMFMTGGTTASHTTSNEDETQPPTEDTCDYEPCPKPTIRSHLLDVDVANGIHSSCTSLRGRPTKTVTRLSSSAQNLKMCKIRPYLTETYHTRSSELLFSTMGASALRLNSSRDEFVSLQALAKRTLPPKSQTNYELRTVLYKNDSNATSLKNSSNNIEAEHSGRLRKDSQHLNQDSDDSLSVDDMQYAKSKLFAFTLPSYWLLHVNVLLFCLSLSVVITHISAYSQYHGLSRDKGSFLISMNGAANVIGRIALGALTQHPVVNAFWLYITCYALAALAILVVTAWTSLLGLLVCIIAFGTFSAAFGPVLSEVCLQIVGIANFNYGYGFLMISMAFGTAVGAPLAGLLYDVTYMYTSSFYFGGGCLLVSALVMVPVTVYRGPPCPKKTRFARPPSVVVDL